MDRAVQLFLQSCQANTDLAKVNFGYLNFDFDQECIEKGRFTCNPPPALLSFFDAATPKLPPMIGGGGKRPRRNALSGLNDVAPEEKSTAIQNTNSNNEWAIHKDEDHTKISPNICGPTTHPQFSTGLIVVAAPDGSVGNIASTIVGAAMANLIMIPPPSTPLGSNFVATNLRISELKMVSRITYHS